MRNFLVIRALRSYSPNEAPVHTGRLGGRSEYVRPATGHRTGPAPAPGAREVVEYRKSGLSLNHIQGCPLDCAYCIRHTYGLWDQRQPRALMPDTEAVERLVSHRYFQAHVTPVQVLNRATDPFLPSVRPHTLAVLADLDGRGLRNHVLVITRHQMKPSDADRLNQLVNLKVTLLFTYSGIDDKRIEPYPSQVAADSLKLMSAPGRRRYRTILYWRPLVPGLNDSDEHLARAYALSRLADATVFTGLFYRDQIARYYRANGLPEPTTPPRAGRSCPKHSNSECWQPSRVQPRCSARPRALPYAHGLPDYNGHYGIRELCESARRFRSAGAAARPATSCGPDLPGGPRVAGKQDIGSNISERAAVVSGLGDEQPRYYLQHALGFQVHDVRHPHHVHRHGRADTGWDTPHDG